MKKIALASIVAASIVALTDCSISKEISKTEVATANISSTTPSKKIISDSETKDSLQLAEIIMDYNGNPKNILLYRQGNSTYILSEREGRFSIDYGDIYSIDESLRSQVSKVPRFNKNTAMNILEIKNNIGDQSRPLDIIMNTIASDERLYKYNIEDYFESKNKTFPEQVAGGQALKGPARDYFLKCKIATEKAIESARVSNDVAQINRLNYLNQFLDENLGKVINTIDLQPGIYHSKLNTKKGNVDCIVSVIEYYHNTDYGNVAKKATAHEKSLTNMYRVIGKNISGLKIPFMLYDDKELPKQNNITYGRIPRDEDLQNKYQKRKAVILYPNEGNNFPNSFVESLPDCELNTRYKTP